MSDSHPDYSQGALVLLGICSDENASFMPGAAGAPDAIRAALYSGSANLTTELGVCLDAHPRFADAGNLVPGGGAEGLMRIENRIAEILQSRCRPLILGGDHAVTYPVIRALSAAWGPVEILHLDAHPDLYEELEGNRLSHGCPFARIMEQGLARRLVMFKAKDVVELKNV